MYHAACSLNTIIIPSMYRKGLSGMIVNVLLHELNFNWLVEGMVIVVLLSKFLKVDTSGC
jgi:hypothetical protein